MGARYRTGRWRKAPGVSGEVLAARAVDQVGGAVAVEEDEIAAAVGPAIVRIALANVVDDACDEALAGRFHQRQGLRAPERRIDAPPLRMKTHRRDRLAERPKVTVDAHLRGRLATVVAQTDHRALCERHRKVAVVPALRGVVEKLGAEGRRRQPVSDPEEIRERALDAGSLRVVPEHLEDHVSQVHREGRGPDVQDDARASEVRDRHGFPRRQIGSRDRPARPELAGEIEPEAIRSHETTSKSWRRTAAAT